MDVDVFPENLYRVGAAPEELSGVDEMEIEVNQQTGAITMTVLPPGVADTTITEIFRAIDALDVIEPGAMLAGKYEVTSVGGNKLSVRPFEPGAAE